jgi:hypothetical protein
MGVAAHGGGHERSREPVRPLRPRRKQPTHASNR